MTAEEEDIHPLGMKDTSRESKQREDGHGQDPRREECQGVQWEENRDTQDQEVIHLSNRGGKSQETHRLRNKGGGDQEVHHKLASREVLHQNRRDSREVLHQDNKRGDKEHHHLGNKGSHTEVHHQGVYFHEINVQVYGIVIFYIFLWFTLLLSEIMFYNLLTRYIEVPKIHF